MIELEKISQISFGISEHISKLTSCLDVMKDIRDSLDRIERANQQQQEIEKLKEEVGSMCQILQKYGLPTASEYEKEFEKIKKLVLSEKWPKAIQEEYICNNEKRSQKRAKDILDVFISEDLKDKKFLDFGCDNEDIVNLAKEKGACASGYDIYKNFNDCDLLFSNFNEIIDNGPYDIILMYDTLDRSENPLDLLNQAKSVMSLESKLFIKCHPWCGRHGTHLYNQINKAFLHLILDDNELIRLGDYSNEKTLRINHPQISYREWFEQTGLNVEFEKSHVTEVDEFFKDNKFLWKKITDHWPDNEFPSEMRIDFMDYILIKQEELHQIF